MKQYFFWKNWSNAEQRLYQVFLFLFILTGAFFSFAWFKGNQNILHWDIVSELDEIPTILNNFSDGNLKFTVNGNAYIVKEQFLASSMKVNYWANYLFLGTYLIALCLLLTALITLKRVYFLGGITIFTAILLSFRLEVLHVFGLTNQTVFLGFFIIFTGIAYYFNEFASGFSLLKRFFSFLVLVIIGVFIIHFSAAVQQPAMALASYGILSATILSAIFIFLVSHEIMASLVWVVSNSRTLGKNSIGQFFIISTIYLLNVLLIFLKNTNAINWNGLIISPFILLIISLLLGFWGFKKYCDATNFFNFNYAGAWLYIGLALITLATIAIAFATDNDSLIEVFADIISYTHLIMGLAFFIHVLVNFIQPLQKGLEVHKIIYKPIFSPLLVARLLALIIIIALMGMKHYFPVYQTFAGYNNAIADYYLTENDPFAAQVYYKQALKNDFQNHHANYALASLAVHNKDAINAEFFFKQALLKNPSTFAFAGRTQALLDEDRYFEALFNLKDGVKKFPKSQELLTNLAYLHARAKGGNDSTLYYLEEAEKYCSNCESSKSNLLAFYAKNKTKNELDLLESESRVFWAKKGNTEKLDSINSFFSSDKNSTSIRANYLAIKNKLGKQSATLLEIKLPKDSALNVSQFALIYNASVRETLNPEHRISSAVLEKLKQKNANADFAEDLTFAEACSNYYKEDKILGIKQLAILANDSTTKKALYNRTVGMWFLEQGVFDKAIQYLGTSGDKNSVEILTQKNYAEIIKNAQMQQAENLLKSAKTEANFKNAISKAPLNSLIINKVSMFYNNQKNQNEAYKIIFDALALNDSSAELWKLYAMQSLSMGLREYAENGLEKVKQLSSPADYQLFLSTYQAKNALIEKASEGFH